MRHVKGTGAILATVALAFAGVVGGLLIIQGSNETGERRVAVGGSPSLRPRPKPTPTTAAPPTTIAPTTTTTTPFQGTPSLPLYGAATYGVTSSGCPSGQWKARVVRSWGNLVSPATTPCAPVFGCTEQSDGTVQCSMFAGVQTERMPLQTAAANVSNLVLTSGPLVQTNGAGLLASGTSPGQSCNVSAGESGSMDLVCNIYAANGSYPSWSVLYLAVEARAASTESAIYMWGKIG